MTAPGHLRAMWLPGLIALALLGLGLLIGLDLVHCLLLSAACLAIGALPPAGAAGIRSPWPPLPYGRRDGARRDVSTLTWTLMSREGGLSSKGRQRVHAVLHEALRLQGIDPDTTAGARRAESLLGREVAAWLADPGSRPLDPVQLSTALSALEHAAASSPASGASTSPPGAPAPASGASTSAPGAPTFAPDAPTPRAPVSGTGTPASRPGTADPTSDAPTKGTP